MLRGDALDDGQAEARALAAACAVAANEGVEDLVELVRIDAGAAVEHAEHHVRRVVVAGHVCHHLDAITAVALRVLDQVDQQALDRDPPQRQHRHRFDAQAHSVLVLVVGRYHLADQLAEIDLLDRFVAAVADEGKELIEDGVHVLDIADHVVGQLIVAGHQL